MKPDYSGAIDIEEKKYITWLTAHTDIEQQRSHGYHGPRYKIYPILARQIVTRYKTIIEEEKVPGWKPCTWIPTTKIIKHEKQVQVQEKKGYEYKIIKVLRIK